MFTINSLSLPTGKTAKLVLNGPTPQTLATTGATMGPQSTSYTLTVDGMGSLTLLDVGDTVPGPGTWGVRVNGGACWYYEGGGQMNIVVDAAGGVNITGGVSSLHTTLQTALVGSVDNPLNKVSPGAYDMVVAVTQVAINETMGEYLFAHPTTFAIYGITDANGNVTQLTTDPNQATCYLKGVLQLEKDTNGKYMNLINLSTSKGNQVVQYNMTMQKGEFYYNAAGLNFTKKQDGTNPWVFKFFTNLAMQDVAKSALPPDVQQRLQNVDENIFSIQQLYLDLNTASQDSIDGVVFPAPVQTPAFQLITLYLAQMQAQNKPLFGVSATFKNTNTPAPTFTPTNVNFCVTPFRDANGNHTNPNLDTLNYLVMFNHNTPPPNPPQSFANNWVTDVQIQGALAIREDPFISFMRNSLGGILQQLSPIMHCKADGHKHSPDDTVIQLDPGVAHAFNTVFDPNSGLFGTFSYNTKDNSSDYGFGYSLSVNGSYGSVCNIYALVNTIKITGSITANGSSIATYSGGSGISNQMPNATFNWSVELQLYFDAANNGQLDLKIINPNFTSDPVIAQHDQSWWEKLLSSFSGFMTTYTNNLGNLRDNVATNIEGNIQTNLNNVLATSNHFVLPGGKTFAFKNPQFTNAKDLASNITYLNPNA